MSPSSKVPFSVRDFFKRFPDDEACLTHVMEVRHGMRHVCRKCGKEATFHRMTDRRAFACANCGDHLYPTAGTIFQDTRTPLQLWFYAIYLFVATRHGVSGKELQRTLGVTYKTAYRMGQQIRDLMAKADGFEMLRGHVEMDEAYVGGRRHGGKRGRGAEGKTIVFGMVERGGRLVAEVIPDVKQATLRNAVLRNVKEGATVSSDELVSYGLLEGDGYQHGHVRHGAKEWSYYDYRHGAFHHTNTIESFWHLFKASVRSTHIHVSPKHMARYLREFTFRANHREMKNAMFDLLIGAL
ncbi:MAG: IS1595 family transposase [Pseudolabrys sp.]|nr:IS1595 family transposase [Pseudolabrys sp.]MCW5697652.1 IS1595 family transposase [Bauldia sp.]